MDYDLQHDAFGNVTNAADASGNAWSYVYGPNAVLLGETAATGDRENVLTRHVDAFRRPTGYGLSVDGVSRGGIGYAYDAEDRPVSVTAKTLTNDAVRVLNAYDYRHRRIRKTVQRYDLSATEWVTRERHDFVWDGWNPVLETVATVEGISTNVTEIQYFWGLDLSNTFQGAGGVGGLLAVSRNGSFYFPLYDNNGNVMKYVDESGSTVAAYFEIASLSSYKNKKGKIVVNYSISMATHVDRKEASPVVIDSSERKGH